MSGRPRIDSISNYDDFWLASAARNATGGDVDMPNVDGNVAAMKPDPVDVGAGDGRLDVHGENGDTRRPTIRSDSLTDDKMSKLTPNLTPSLMAHTYFNDISPLSKPLLPSSAHAEGMPSIDLRMPTGFSADGSGLFEMFHNQEGHPSIPPIRVSAGLLTASGEVHPLAAAVPSGAQLLATPGLAPATPTLSSAHDGLMGLVGADDVRRLRSDSLVSESDISVGSAGRRERLVSISSLVEDPYLFTADLRPRSRSNSISAYDFSGTDMGLPHLGLTDGLSGGIPSLNGYFDKYDSEDHMDPYMHPDYTATGHELGVTKKPSRSRQRYKGPVGSGATEGPPASVTVSPPSRRRTNQTPGMSAESPAVETPTVKRKRKAPASGGTPASTKKQATPASKSKAKLQSASKPVEIADADAGDVEVDVTGLDDAAPPPPPKPKPKSRAKRELEKATPDPASTAHGSSVDADGFAVKPQMIGTLTLEERRLRIERYLEKRKKRVWRKKINYKCRQKLADGRLRIKGRFVSRTELEKMIKDGTMPPLVGNVGKGDTIDLNALEFQSPYPSGNPPLGTIGGPGSTYGAPSGYSDNSYGGPGYSLPYGPSSGMPAATPSGMQHDSGILGSLYDKDRDSAPRLAGYPVVTSTLGTTTGGYRGNPAIAAAKRAGMASGGSGIAGKMTPGARPMTTTGGYRGTITATGYSPGGVGLGRGTLPTRPSPNSATGIVYTGTTGYSSSYVPLGTIGRGAGVNGAAAATAASNLARSLAGQPSGMPKPPGSGNHGLPASASAPRGPPIAGGGVRPLTSVVARPPTTAGFVPTGSVARMPPPPPSSSSTPTSTAPPAQSSSASAAAMARPPSSVLAGSGQPRPLYATGGLKKIIGSSLGTGVRVGAGPAGAPTTVMASLQQQSRPRPAGGTTVVTAGGVTVTWPANSPQLAHAAQQRVAEAAAALAAKESAAAHALAQVASVVSMNGGSANTMMSAPAPVPATASVPAPAVVEPVPAPAPTPSPAPSVVEKATVTTSLPVAVPGIDV